MSTQADELEKLYTSAETGFGGLDAFWSRSVKPSGIATKKQTAEWLRNFKLHARITPHPGLSDTRPDFRMSYRQYMKPNVMHQMDLIDMNGQFEGETEAGEAVKYILTVVDAATRKIAAVGLPNKTAKATLAGLKKIYPATLPWPEQIQHDGGKEFASVDKEAKTMGVPVRIGRTVLKTDSALVENANRRLEMRLVPWMDAAGDLDKYWPQELEALVQGVNRTKMSTLHSTKAVGGKGKGYYLLTPDEAYEGKWGAESPFKGTVAKMRARSEFAKPIGDTKKGRMVLALQAKLNAGDHVRLPLHPAGVHDRRKAFDEKWSQQLFQITHIREDAITKLRAYFLSDGDGAQLSENGYPTIFYAQQLLLACKFNECNEDEI